MSRDLLLAVPTRGRPGNIERLISCFEATSRADTELLIGIDEDDPCYVDYQVAVRGHKNVSLEVNRAHLKGVVALMNWLIVPKLDEYRFVGSIGDDNTLDTPGWDQRVCESLETHNFCFADDLYPRERGSLCCHVFARSEAIKALGYFGPPSIRHMYVDPVWMAWGKATSIEFLPDVVMKHHHYSIGAAPVDLSYQISNSLTADDCLAYNEYMRTDFATDVAKLKGATFDIKQFNRDLNIPPVFGSPLD